MGSLTRFLVPNDFFITGKIEDTMKPELIKVNKQTGELEVHDDVYAIEAFNKLMRTRYFTEGDHDGRKKHYHLKLLRFIKNYADYGSRMSGIPDKEKLTKALRDAGIDPKQFKMDAVIQNAIDVYIEYQNEYIPSARILNSLERAMLLSSYAVDTYTEQMNMVITANAATLKNMLADGSVNKDEVMANLMAANQLLQSNLESVMTIAKQLPNNIKSIKELQKAVAEEEEQAKRLAGGKVKGRREDPK